ncbi:hypothetical protein ISCGN_030795 [Ixodes scapularis]
MRETVGNRLSILGVRATPLRTSEACKHPPLPSRNVVTVGGRQLGSWTEFDATEVGSVVSSPEHYPGDDTTPPEFKPGEASDLEGNAFPQRRPKTNKTERRYWTERTPLVGGNALGCIPTDCDLYIRLRSGFSRLAGLTEKYQARLCDLLLASFPASTWKVQLSILKALRKFLVRLSWLSPEKRTEYDSGLTSVTSGIVDVACQALDMTKYAALSSEALLLMKDLLEKIKAADVVWVLTPSSANKLKNSVATIAKKDNNLELKSLAQDLADLAMNTC